MNRYRNIKIWIFIPLLLGMVSCAITNEIVFEKTTEKSNRDNSQAEISPQLKSQREFHFFRPLFLYVHSYQKFEIVLQSNRDSSVLIDKICIKQLMATVKNDTLFYVRKTSNDAFNQKELDGEYVNYMADSILFSKGKPKNFLLNCSYDIYLKNGMVKTVTSTTEFTKKRYIAIYPLIAFTYGG